MTTDLSDRTGPLEICPEIKPEQLPGNDGHDGNDGRDGLLIGAQKALSFPDHQYGIYRHHLSSSFPNANNDPSPDLPLSFNTNPFLISSPMPSPINAHHEYQNACPECLSKHPTYSNSQTLDSDLAAGWGDSGTGEAQKTEHGVSDRCSSISWEVQRLSTSGGGSEIIETSEDPICIVTEPEAEGVIVYSAGDSTGSTTSGNDRISENANHTITGTSGFYTDRAAVLTTELPAPPIYTVRDESAPGFEQVTI